MQAKPSGLFDSFFKFDPSDAFAQLIATQNAMLQVLNDIKDQGELKPGVVEKHDPIPWERNIYITGGATVSQNLSIGSHIRITNVVLSTDTQCHITVMVGEASMWFDVYLVAFAPVQMVFPGLDAKDVIPGLRIWYTSDVAANVSMHLRGWQL